MQFKEKLMNQTWENGKKNPNFQHNFGLFGLNLEPQTFSVDFTSTTS